MVVVEYMLHRFRYGQEEETCWKHNFGAFEVLQEVRFGKIVLCSELSDIVESSPKFGHAGVALVVGG